MTEVDNNYRQLSWKLVLTLIAIIATILIGVIGYNFSYDSEIEKKAESIAKEKVDKQLYERDRTELLLKLTAIEVKLDRLLYHNLQELPEPSLGKSK